MIIATIHLDLGAVGLTQTFESIPEMTVEAERIAAHSTRWTMPCLWITAPDLDRVDEAFAADPSVDQVVDMYDFADETYCHLEWADDVEDRIDDYVDKQGSILSATATSDGWELEFRFATRDQFDEFRAVLADQDIAFELLDLFEPGSPRLSMGDLTPAQRNALVVAADRGYFDVPREISARELANELDTTHQSLSELLRRGTRKLVTSTLGLPDTTPSGDDDSYTC